MNDNKMLKICIITSIVGLLGIVCLTGFVLPEKLNIGDIDKSKIDNNIEVNATITDVINTKSGVKIVTLTDNTGSINMVVFASTLTNFNLERGKHVDVIAKVSVYNGQLELILEESNNIREI